MGDDRACRVLVTGAAGFVGINVARALAVRGHRVVAFDHRAPDDLALQFFGTRARNVVWVCGDVQEAQELGGALKTYGVECIVHAAAMTATTPEWERERAGAILGVNLMGTVAVLESAHSVGVGRVVIVSSAAALGPGYGDGRPIPEAALAAPTDLYGISKRAVEMVAARLSELYPLEVVTVRLAQPYGPMERPSPDRAALSPIAEWVAAAVAGRPLRAPSLDSAKDWLYIEDVAAAFVGLVEASPLRYAMYNLGLGANVTVREVTDAIRRVWPGLKVSVTSELPANPNLTHGRLRGPLEMVRLREELGFRPRFTIEAGIARYCAWVQSGEAALPEGFE